MMKLSDLKPFQTKAAAELSSMIQAYGTDSFKYWFDPETGKPSPFLCRLKAITGAGKTPILAVTASQLKDGIVLWTTNRGGVVSQTFENLSPGGKYSSLLPEGTSVYMMSEMTSGEWQETLSATKGLTILIATVASFNQDDNLRIHQPVGGIGLSRWQMLSRENCGEFSRHRQLFVFYDEGHGATPVQFHRLAGLHPWAFVFASASPLPADLVYLLPGRNSVEKQKSLAARTVAVPTKMVVEAGLLKTRLYFTECNTTQENALRKAHEKFQELQKKLEPHGLNPIACFIVNSTERGVDVWSELVRIGVPKESIAVHLNGAREEAYRRYGSYMGINDTYTGKKPADRSPEALRSGGFTHLIWNLTLREGWDEPLAYVAYIDSRGKSETDISQKIGRFIRQPNAKPFDDPDLNAAYFYFNVDDEQFVRLIEQTQKDLEAEGHEVFRGTIDDVYWPPSREVEVRYPRKAPRIRIDRGDPFENDQIVLDAVRVMDLCERQATGRMVTVALEVAEAAINPGLRKEETTDLAGSITAWEYISAQLQRIDTNIVNSTGSIFTPKLKDHPRMRQEVQYGSPALSVLDTAVDEIKRRLEGQITLKSLGELDMYEVGPFRLVSPDVTGVSPTLEYKYKVRSFANSVHGEYNGMNPFEVAVAEALDGTGNCWCRNPATKHGYAIPLPIYGADSASFMPDFLYWTDKNFWVIDPKGKHILEGALSQKMWDLSELGVRIAFILEGTYKREGDRYVRSGTKGYTVIRKFPGGVREKSYKSLSQLVSDLQ